MLVRRWMVPFCGLMMLGVAACGDSGGGESGTDAEVCNNLTDDDGDGAVDCDDTDCVVDAACIGGGAAEVCTGGQDEDGDGAIDCEDSDCANDAACAATPEICTGGEDEDGDGAIDCDDSDCADDIVACPPDPTDEICDNGVDDDGDGAVDCDDSDCADACAAAGECGDGTVDAGEACDEGDANSDTEADACRTDCTLASCGDGVVDGGEECDDGADGSETCSTTCENVFVAQCTDADEFVLDQVATLRGQTLVWTGSSADWSDDRTPDATCTRDGDGPEAVFSWTPDTTQWVLITTESAATTVPTILELGATSCDDPLLVDCDEVSYERSSTIHTVMQANTTYFIYAHALGEGDVSLEVIPSQIAGREGEGCAPQTGRVCGDGLACIGSTCEPIPGTCGATIDASTALAGSWSTGYAGTVEIGQQGDNHAGSCGGEGGNEVVLELSAESAGQVTVNASSDEDVTVYLRRSCDSAAREAACAADGSATADVIEGAPLFVIVDGPDAFGASVQLNIDVLPFAEFGEACGEGVAVCDSDLICSPTRSVCTEPAGALGETCLIESGDEACVAGLFCSEGDAVARCAASDARTCEQPYLLNDEGVQIGNRISATFPMDAGVPEGLYSSSCSRDPSQIVEWTAPVDGIYRVVAVPSTGATLRAFSERVDCSRASSETECVGAAPARYENEFTATMGERRWFHVSGTGNITLQVIELVELDEGAACDPDSETETCGTGLTCGDALVCERSILYSCSDTTRVVASRLELAAGTDFEFDLRAAGNAQTGTCGGALGNEATLLFAPEGGGVASLEVVDGETDVSLYVRRFCEQPDTETLCANIGDGDAALDFEVFEGERLSLIVDANTADLATTTVRLTFEEQLGAGDDCTEGTCGPGLSCNDDFVCAARLRVEGELCNEELDIFCVETNVCSEVDESRRCVLIGGEGTLCVEDAECAAGFACAFELEAEVGTCTVPSPLGEACIAGGCEAGLACIGERGSAFCSATGDTLDARCEPGERRCSDGLFCQPNEDIFGGTCQAQAIVGDRCASGLGCLSGYCAPQEDEGVFLCEPSTPRGNVCRTDAECGVDAACIGPIGGGERLCEIVPTQEGGLCEFTRSEFCEAGLECATGDEFAICSLP